MAVQVSREWYAINDAAVVLGRSSRAVRQAVHRGVIPSALIAGRRLIPASWLACQEAVGGYGYHKTCASAPAAR